MCFTYMHHPDQMLSYMYHMYHACITFALSLEALHSREPLGLGGIGALTDKGKECVAHLAAAVVGVKRLGRQLPTELDKAASFSAFATRAEVCEQLDFDTV